MPGVGASAPKNYFAPPPPPISPTSSFGNPSTFTAAANTQGSDYDKIMAGYDSLINSSLTNPIAPGSVSGTQVGAPQHVNTSSINYSPISAQTTNYQQSGDVTKSLADLSNLADTGGYSDQDKADIRARDISPIRSIYSNAQQNAERQKALAGGYSPNFNATQASMARTEADQISGATTTANAGIAQNVAANRLAAASPYASAAGAANAQQAEADQFNANIINQINEANASNSLYANTSNASNALSAAEFNSAGDLSAATGNANRSDTASQFNVQAALDAAKTNRGLVGNALAGKTSLYGTTPALTNTFGNQVVQAAQLGQGQQNLNVANRNSFGNLARSFG